MDEKNKGANEEGNLEASPVTPAEDNGGESKPEDGSTPSSEENKGSDENKRPAFHEDPAVQDYLNRQWSQRESKLREEITSQVRKEIEENFGKMTKKEEQGEEIPEWFGGDLNQWKQFLAFQEKTIERARASAVEEFQRKQEEQSTKVKEANEWFDTSISTIENLTGKKIDRNALLAYTLEHNGAENKFVDSHGRWDYIKAFKEMQEAAAGGNAGLQQRKKIANDTTRDGSKPESEERTYKTSEDFKKSRPW